MKETEKTLKTQVRKFPKSPGVYLMKSAQGQMLYVGKASDLRSRVGSYFNKEAHSRYHVRFLMGRVQDIDYMVTSNAKEALLLENTLIKKHRPRYNINLKDDKSYVSLKLGIRHVAPRLLVTRRIRKDGSLYFGPYASAQACREVVDLVERHFGLRSCSEHEYANRTRPCLKYQINLCTAPCVAKISLMEYGERVRQVRAFLEGRTQQVEAWAKERMNRASMSQRYEEAARFRDLLQAMKKTLERQRVHTHFGRSQDAIAWVREDKKVLIFVLPYEEGKLQEGRNFWLKSIEEDDELLESFLNQYYEEAEKIPQEILLSQALSGMALLEQVLKERRGGGFKLTVPQRGEKLRILKLAQQNAQARWERQNSQEARLSQALSEIQERLHLSEMPERIECYDISHFQGSATYGSMVTFVEGMPKKDCYRRFKLKTMKGPNDFASLYEVLCRRFRRAKEDTSLDSPWALPQLIVIDGGKGQLKAGLEALKDENITGVALVALAKSRVKKPEQKTSSPASGVEKTQERFFLPGRKNPVTFSSHSPALKLLTFLRDEAHRFGITAQRGAQVKKSLRSVLESVPGLGPVRRAKLMEHYGSYEGIRKAEVKEVSRLLKISLRQAEEMMRVLGAISN